MSISKHHQPVFHQCRSCGKNRVVRPGDYCRKCAVVPNDDVANERYIIVEPHTMEDTAEKTGIALPYLRSKFTHVSTMQCYYVLYKINGDWRDVVVDKQFYLPRAMQTIFERNE